MRSGVFWGFSLAIGLTVGAAYLIIFSSYTRIKTVQISGNEKTPTAELQNAIQNQIDKKIFSILSKSIFLTNTGDIKNSLLKQYPQIETIEVRRELRTMTLIVQIKERGPVGIWCNNNECFLIDGSGVIFEKTLPEGNLLIKSENYDKTVFLGQKILTEQQIGLMLNINEKLRSDLKLSIQEFNLVPQNRLNVKTSENWEIYFNLQEDVNWQLTKVKSVLEQIIQQDKRGNLEYIDLRFNRVYYKFRD